MDYMEFRLRATPSLDVEGSWNVELIQCPLANRIGLRATVSPALTRGDLDRLRGAVGYPNPAFIRATGAAVWKTVLPPQIDEAFRESLQAARAQNSGLRLVLVSAGSVTGDSNAAVQPGEMPVEALFDDHFAFLAQNQHTPVSRRLGGGDNLPAHRTVRPLRLLIVSAAPNDIDPDPGVEVERKAIEAALQSVVSQGALVIEACPNATPRRLREALARACDIVHFIGHGGFSSTSLNGEPMGYFCLESDEDGSTFALDGETLYALLRNTNVRLVVLTACSTAAVAGAPVLPLSPYPPAALGGLAQRLISGDSLISAVVAMQFDLETKAAPIFSEAFYDALILEDAPLDEAVRRARLAIVAEMLAGHRAWITPVAFVRCEGARVFELPALVAELSEEIRAELTQLEKMSAKYEKALASIAALAPQIRAEAGVETLRQETQLSLDEIVQRRADLLGDSLRLVGGRAEPDGDLECELVLRLRHPARVGFLAVAFSCPAQHFTFSKIVNAATFHGQPIRVAQQPDRISLNTDDVSGGDLLPAAEHSLAKLVFKVSPAAPIGLSPLAGLQATLIMDGVQVNPPALGAAVFVQSA